MGLLWLLFSWLPLPLCAQVSICYDFENAYPNSRPLGWGALPNLDFHYVGVTDNLAHSGTKSLGNSGTTCYTIMPDEGLNYSADSIWLTFWYYLHLNTDFFEVGYLTDATDSTTFHALDTLHGWQQQWHFAAVDLSSVPTGARIAFFGHDIFAGDGTFWLDDMHLTSQPCAAWGLRVAENRADSVRLEWQSAGEPTVTLTINWNTPYNVNGNSFTFARNYYESFNAGLIAQCPYSGCMPIQPYSEIYIRRYREGTCLDATDINSSMAVPYYGTPVEPYLHTGTNPTTASGVSGIWAGSHTINTNQGPEVTSGMMVFPSTIPPGDNVTLRLGNRLGDWESASMLYTITVDTNEADLLVMKYTVAMAFGTFQGPDLAHHNDTLHPAWFRIELMDSAMAQIQPASCNLFYIDAWDTSGWDEMNNMYKRRNFTGMAFDLAPYHGRQLRLRVTATEGAVNNRWCYGYYNFECLKSNDAVGSCESDSMTLTAPYGFRYRWYRDGATATIDTVQSITVVADGSLYHCQLIDRFNPACSRTISRRVLPGPYVEVRDTVVENQLPHTWGGMTFRGAADTTFTIPATEDCDTTVHYTLHVWPNRTFRIERRFCPDEWPVVWEGHTFDGPDSILLKLTDSHGADSTVTLVALQAPGYEVSDTVVLCPGQPFVYGGTDYGGPVAFDTLMATVDGCDSLVHVTLMQRDSTFALHTLHSTDGIHWADTLPIVVCSNQKLYLVDSTDGSTDWLWTLGADSTAGRMALFSFEGTDSVTPAVLTLLATSLQGCEDSLRWPLLIIPAPQAAFSWQPSEPCDVWPEVQLLNYSEPDSCRWLWTLPTADGGTDSLSLHSPAYRWAGQLPVGDYDVRLVATMATLYEGEQYECSDTASHTVTVVTSLLQFPNLVTPNGDGINDTWQVVNLVELGQYSENELWIFNSWGLLVHHAKDIHSPEQAWDPNERHCPDGTYYFRFSARGAHGIVKRNGTIEVLR